MTAATRKEEKQEGNLRGKKDAKDIQQEERFLTYLGNGPVPGHPFAALV